MRGRGYLSARWRPTQTIGLPKLQNSWWAPS
jgi:hypothetical protein